MPTGVYSEKNESAPRGYFSFKSKTSFRRGLACIEVKVTKLSPLEFEFLFNNMSTLVGHFVSSPKEWIEELIERKERTDEDINGKVYESAGTLTSPFPPICYTYT